jgi:hypothetical protein
VGVEAPVSRYRPAAMSDSGVAMIVSFAVAALVVAPFGYIVVRRVLQERRTLRLDVAPAEAPNADPSADDIGRVVAAIDDGATQGVDPFEVVLPRSVSLDGRPAPAALVDAIVGDAVRRSGLRIVRDEPGPDGRVLVLERA